MAAEHLYKRQAPIRGIRHNIRSRLLLLRLINNPHHLINNKPLIKQQKLAQRRRMIKEKNPRLIRPVWLTSSLAATKSTRIRKMWRN